MVARKVHCMVIEIPASETEEVRVSEVRDLLPWADPYIAGLVQRLKSEIEAEYPRNEATPPLAVPPMEFERPDNDTWTRWDGISSG